MGEGFNKLKAQSLKPKTSVVNVRRMESGNVEVEKGNDSVEMYISTRV